MLKKSILVYVCLGGQKKEGSHGEEKREDEGSKKVEDTQ
jgi:hypothetical protein